MNLAVKFTLFSLSIYAANGYAHARWAEAEEGGLTPARSASAGLKSGPCGNIEREANPDRPATILISGSVVTLKIFQSIFHQGDYRVYFSDANDEKLFEYDRGLGVITGAPSSENTLIAPGKLPDESGVMFYDATVTLPNIECDDCVLQLVQYMPDNLNNPYYYSCADIILTADGANPSDPADVTPPVAISEFTVLTGDAQVVLNWTNPSEDFTEVLVLQGNQALNGSPQMGLVYAVGDTIGNAKLIYKGPANNQKITGLTNGTAYAFSAFAVDDNLNYSLGVSQNVALPVISTNLAPSVNLIAEQNGVSSTRFTTIDGEVIVQASVQDSNVADAHIFDWSGAASSLIDLDSIDTTFIFDPSQLSTGTYEIAVSVSDNGEPSLSDTATLTFTIEEIIIVPPSNDTPETEVPNNTNGGAGVTNLYSLLVLMFFGVIYKLNLFSIKVSNRLRIKNYKKYLSKV